MLGRCRSVDVFEKLNPIGEGTYGRVFRARDKKTGEIVALKKVHLHKSTVGFPATGLREIGILFSLDHPNIVKLKEVVLGRSPGQLSSKHVGSTRSAEGEQQSTRKTSEDEEDASSVITYLVFEFCDHDLASLVDHATSSFSRAEIKCILQYLLRGLESLHLHNIIHRDIKLPNIFMTNKGELKLGDFGLAR